MNYIIYCRSNCLLFERVAQQMFSETPHLCKIYTGKCKTQLKPLWVLENDYVMKYLAFYLAQHTIYFYQKINQFYVKYLL